MHAEGEPMKVEQLVRDADSHTGEDLGRTIFAEVRAALHDGADRDQIIGMVTELYDYLGEADREDDQDSVAEVLDSLTGFSSPAATL